MKLLKIIFGYGILILGLSLGLTLSAIASEFEETKIRAEKGDALAQYSLGGIYKHGFGVQSNPKKAIEWYTKAADQGDSSSAYKLGEMYQNGDGITQDDIQAFKWYQRAGQLGDIAAQSKVGLMYENGKGVRQDYNKAFEWYQRSAYEVIDYNRPEKNATYDKSDGSKVEWYKKLANQGDGIAQSIVGFLYYNGEGVKQSKFQVQKWFGMACAQNLSMSCDINRVLQHPSHVIDKNALKILSYNKNVALHYNAKNGNPESQYFLGRIYYTGEGVPQSYAKAFYWFQKAAENGHLAAQSVTGSMYHLGQGVSQNYTKAFDWYTKATESEETPPKAQYNLGLMYYQGEGVPQSYAKAFYWFQKAANNTSISVKFFHVTPEREDVLAQFVLGLMYYKGEGVRQDKVQSKSWFGKACDNGIQSACDNYRKLNEQGYW